jgi:hypothetical protein
MRRLVLLTVLATALVAPAAAFAVLQNGSDDDGALSVKNGRGKVALGVPYNGAGVPFNGAAVGRIGHGKVWITDPIADDGDGPTAWGCDNSPGGDTTDTTLYCSGDNLRFRAVGGKYKIVVVGRGIFLSAVGHGTLTLNGAGDSPLIDADGLFSINDSPFRSLPNDAKTFLLAAPAGG